MLSHVFNTHPGVNNRALLGLKLISFFGATCHSLVGEICTLHVLFLFSGIGYLLAVNYNRKIQIKKCPKYLEIVLDFPCVLLTLLSYLFGVYFYFLLINYYFF